MDKGAHFRRCDFQVHSPRDLHWSGPRPVTSEERLSFAREFVRACRDKGLQGVAITDHHDMAFVDCIRAAAAGEADSTGSAFPAEQRLAVFPGMELTLGVPCQALLIFDAEFPTDMFDLVMHTLGIVPNPAGSHTTAVTERLGAFLDLKSLHERLDQHNFLKGRYIVLPNVSDGGNATLLRSGFHQHYCDMPSVGGYTDKGIDTLGAGNRAIIEGRDSTYGSKAIGVFQTSDARSQSFADLGSYSTWVKWSTPTAEALRQACLARESRLSQVQPLLPHSFISAISVSNSRFLGPFSLELNQQFDAMIGGRGTGKSTILEYIRWAVCDEPIAAVVEDIEATDYRAKRQRLIERTLTAFGANVQVTYVKHGVQHTVRRFSGEPKLMLKIGEGEFEPTTEDQVRSLLPIQAYSQKQLSSVGVRLEELHRFIRAPVRDEIEDAERHLDRLRGEIAEEHARLVRKRRLTIQQERIAREIRSIVEQIEATRKNLQGIDPGDKRMIAQKGLVDIERGILDRWAQELDSSLVAVRLLVSRLMPLPTGIKEVEAMPHSDQMKATHDELVRIFQTARDHLIACEREFQQAVASGSAVTTMTAGIRELQVSFDERYEQAKWRSSTHESVLQQLSALEDRLKQLRASEMELSAGISELGVPEKTFPTLVAQWKQGQRSISDLLAAQCGALTALSGGLLRATLRRHADFSGLSEAIQTQMRGSGIRASRYEALFDALARHSEPIDKWWEVLAELDGLAALEKPLPETGVLPETPMLRAFFNANDLTKLGNRLTSESWLELALSSVGSFPEFEYRSREEEYIPFQEASAGQQATALLWALLNQEGPPLIIDQPEDDLDSQIIIEIVQQLWQAKSKRQLIFASHNANLVVNGDAELVVCCANRIAGEQSGGIIKLEGAIDMPAVRDEITNVMEGGEEAFKLRRDKYGF